MSGTTSEPKRRVLQRLKRLAIVLAGIVAGQFILYGPSLAGQKILLPLDNLALPNVYFPDVTGAGKIHPADPVRMDPILQFEPDRLFAIKELRAGRFPMWTPYEYGGAPFIWPKYSPFLLFTCLTKSPVILAWAQLLAALVAGTGMFLFCRRVAGTGFWPAALAAWCYPLTGFFIFWQGFPTCLAVCWLPWVLLAVENAVRGKATAPAALALATGLALVSGHMDVAGQVLLVSGLFALWRLLEIYGWQFRRFPKAILFLAAGWALGFLLAAPHILPVLKYAKTGERMTQRAAGAEERPPVGIAALPQAVLPDMYGSSQYGSVALFPDGESTLIESSSAAYAGILATLLVAPLAWFSKKHFRMNLFWTLLAIFGLGWCLDIPGIVTVLRLPGLNMMSHNRLVFATSFSIIVMTAIGMEALRQGQVQWRRALWLTTGLLAGFLAWCAYRAEHLPEPLATKLGRYVQGGHSYFGIDTLEEVKHAQIWFSWHYTVPAIWCGCGLIVCLLLRREKSRHLPFAIGVLLLADLLWFGHGRNIQCNPAFYYPKIPALVEASKSTGSRVIGFDCLPPKLSSIAGLRDVRGYDPVDPSRWLALLTNAADVRSPIASYAKSLWLMPQLLKTNSAQFVRLPPILNLLSVRYVVFRGTPPPGIQPSFQSPDYYVMENPSALPRAFVPEQIEIVTNDGEQLEKLAAPDFNPEKTAYLESSVALPQNCRGSVEIKQETPMHIAVGAQMKTAGLLVLADSWNAGWKVTLDGNPVPILRTDYDLRGIVLPSGASTVDFRYDSDTVRRAFQVAIIATGIIVCWLAIVMILKARRFNSQPPNGGLKPCKR
jgi:hypothetical protein